MHSCIPIIIIFYMHGIRLFLVEINVRECTRPRYIKEIFCWFDAEKEVYYIDGWQRLQGMYVHLCIVYIYIHIRFVKALRLWGAGIRRSSNCPLIKQKLVLLCSTQWYINFLGKTMFQFSSFMFCNMQEWVTSKSYIYNTALPS